MLVYRFEVEVDNYNITKGEYEKEWKGVFHKYIDRHSVDAEYHTYGSTLPDHKHYDDSRFACRSIDKLISYFGSDFAKLISKPDVRVMEYEVNARDLIYSRQHCEVVFKIDTMKSKRVVKMT